MDERMNAVKRRLPLMGLRNVVRNFPMISHLALPGFERVEGFFEVVYHHFSGSK